MKMSVKKIAIEGLLLAAASIAFLIESLIPPLMPVAPYVKIGVANVFVLFVLVCFGVKDALVFVIAKNLLTALVVPFAFVLNFAGSLSSFVLMAALYMSFSSRLSLVAVSVAGSMVSNIVRTGVAVVMMDAPSLYVQLPFVGVFGICAGIIIGILTILSLKHLPERLTNLK